MLLHMASLDKLCFQTTLKGICVGLFIYIYILAFSKNLIDHVIHLRVVLEVLLKHQLYARQSKRVFGWGEMQYLGHIISRESVKANPSKIAAIQQWSILTFVKALRGFLGLSR